MKVRVFAVNKVKHPASKVPVFQYHFNCGHRFVGDLRKWWHPPMREPMLIHPQHAECGDCK